MKKQNLALYGAGTPAGFFFWQIFQSEHRIWVTDKREVIPGASYWQKDILGKTIDIKKSEYSPINGVVIFKVHKDDIIELFQAIVQIEKPNVLVFDCLSSDVVELIADNITPINISCLKADKDIQLLEDLYHIDRLVLKGGNTSYWKELLEDGLLNVNVDVES